MYLVFIESTACPWKGNPCVKVVIEYEIGDKSDTVIWSVGCVGRTRRANHVSIRSQYGSFEENEPRAVLITMRPLNESLSYSVTLLSCNALYYCGPLRTHQLSTAFAELPPLSVWKS
jgi:hypothetical protein